MYSDNQLIKKVNKANDRRAANELITRYYHEMYVFVYKQTMDIELSKDLTQEIFILVLKGLPLFDYKKASFRTWMYHIAFNKITDYFRSRYHKQILLETELENLESPAEVIGEENFIEKIYESELIQQAMMIIVEFGNEWVRIFQLKLFQDKTFTVISQELGIPENTVKTRYYTMLKRLRKELKT